MEHRVAVPDAFGVQGEERLGTDFTNFAQIKGDPQFIDTLDYIFISPAVEVKEVMHLPHRNDVKGPFPSKAEPSDHIMLAATLTVKGK